MKSPVKMNTGGAYEDIETKTFSGGEVSVQLSDRQRRWIVGSVNLRADLRSAAAVFQLMMTVDAIRQISHNCAIHLECPYFPYARQDRVCNPGEALSVKVMADLINSLKFAAITIWDPHSDVTPALLNNCRVVPVEQLLYRVPILAQKPILVAPDAGALKKVMKCAKLHNLEMVSATKVRDPQTMEISGTKVDWGNRTYGGVRDKDFLIVDDICDGGRTFIELAKHMRAAIAGGKIYLYVTHGIFSMGPWALSPHIDRVFTPNNFWSITRNGTETNHIITEI